MYLGAAQLGERFPIGAFCDSAFAGGAAVSPASAPTITVWNDAGSVVYQGAIPPVDLTAGQGLFSRTLHLGPAFSVGRHAVKVDYGTRSAIAHFEILPGGSTDGAVIAIAYVDRPHARFVVQQLDSGRIVRGREPRV